jgi:hypothetical protein
VDGLLSNSCIKGKVTSVQKHQTWSTTKTVLRENATKSSTATAVFLLLDYEVEGPGRLGQLGRRGRVVFLFALGQRFLPTELKWL